MPAVRQVSREDVLDVAGRVFAARGFGETSLRQLIAETAMSPTAFYARYASKQAVLEALVERLVQRVFLAASSAFTSAKNVDEAFETLPDVLAKELPAEKHVVRLMMTEAAALPSLRKSLHGAYRTLARLVGSSLPRSRAYTGEIAGWAMFGAIYAQIMRWAVFEEIGDAHLHDELRRTTKFLRSTVR